MTTQPVSDVYRLKCFTDLSQNGPKWVREIWGDGWAVGLQGTDEQITQTYNLFINYDPRKKAKFGESAHPIALTPLYHGKEVSLSYIYITPERLFNTLRFYFEVMMARELGRLMQDGEDPDDQKWEVDEKLVGKLADQAATHFVQNHISVRCFVPEAPQPLLAEHSLGRADREEYTLIEDYASMVNA